MAHPPNFLMEDYGRIYADVRDSIEAADLAFANLEFVVDPSRPYSGYPYFNVHPPYVIAAIEAGFDVFALANNHTADFHWDGISATESSLRELATRYNIVSSGISMGQPWAWRSETVAPESIAPEADPEGSWAPPVGFISVSLNSNEWSARDSFYFLGSEASREAFLQWVEKEAARFEVYVVSVHGGDEYVLRPNDRKRAFLDAVAAAGVDVVWSHHPHVLQPFRYVRRENGSQGLIMYSTGNFVSGQTWRLGPEDYRRRRAYTGDSAVYSVSLAPFGGRSTVSHVDVRLISHYIDSNRQGVVVRYLDELADLPPTHPWAAYYRARYAFVRRFADDPQLRFFEP